MLRVCAADADDARTMGDTLRQLGFSVMVEGCGIPSDATPYLKLPSATKTVSVELTYHDGSVSEIKSFQR
jgi:hypothetical protein